MDHHGDQWPIIVDHLDATWHQYHERLQGLTDHEHLWLPSTAASCSVHLDGDRWLVDDFERGKTGVVVTSIAWRMWHIAVDCLESYSQRAFATRGTELADLEWVGTADQAITATEAAWACFREEMGALGAGGRNASLGPSFGPFEDRSYVALALHAQHEVSHHGAEVALLRDLYAHR